jgi:hypothetical protein
MATSQLGVLGEPDPGGSGEKTEALKEEGEAQVQGNMGITCYKPQHLVMARSGRQMDRGHCSQLCSPRGQFSEDKQAAHGHRAGVGAWLPSLGFGPWLCP